MVDEENEFRESINSTDDLIWFLDHSELFRMKIMVEAKHFLVVN